MTCGLLGLTLLFTMIESLSNTLMTLQAATRKILNYQIVVGSLVLMNLPLSYIWLKYGVAHLRQFCMFAIFLTANCYVPVC